MVMGKEKCGYYSSMVLFGPFGMLKIIWFSIR
jgi:hypothetical protein